MAESIAIKHRPVDDRARSALVGIHPVLQRIYAARGVTDVNQLSRSLKDLPDFQQLKNSAAAAALLQQAIDENWRILIVADYDADGATSCALAMRGLTMLGASQVDYLVPDRFEYGYGLTPEIVEVALTKKPDLLVTVDNGISSLSGVALARAAGCRVLVTDHHLPGDRLPDADVIVNPNQPDDAFPSKALAGVGVMFYVLMAVRARLREQGYFAAKPEPNLAELLDLVALGTVADVVPLDALNRKLVHQGLMRIRSGQCCPGITALAQVAARDPAQLQTSDLGFGLGPRLNAAGRLESMSLGIECLLSDQPDAAMQMAQTLDDLNQERREVEADMQAQAFDLLKTWHAQAELPNWGLCLFQPDWHQGVIGILASRIKQRVHRPVIAFAQSNANELKGSARSIEGLHIRDVLDDIAAKHPDVLQKFGGHAMAAGLTLAADQFDRFCILFDEAVQRRLNDQPPEQVYWVDGELAESEFNLDFATGLASSGPWGQAFPEPQFVGDFKVVQARVLKEKHLKMVLQSSSAGRSIDGIAFHVDDPYQWVGQEKMRLVYKLSINRYRGQSSIQLIVEHLECCR